MILIFFINNFHLISCSLRQLQWKFHLNSHTSTPILEVNASILARIGPTASESVLFCNYHEWKYCFSSIWSTKVLDQIWVMLLENCEDQLFSIQSLGEENFSHADNQESSVIMPKTLLQLACKTRISRMLKNTKVDPENLGQYHVSNFRWV